MSTLSENWVDKALRYALPGRCAFCLGATDPGQPWCTGCFAELPWNLAACPRCGEPQYGAAGRVCGACLSRPPAFDRTHAPLCYAGEVLGLVQRFKFHASPRAGTVLLALLESALPETVRAWPEAMVAVPLHPQRARQRGFDQAEWLARRLVRRLGCPLKRAVRVRDTRSQRGLDRTARRRNLSEAFRIGGVLPRRVVLVDDVMTTGGTLDALARACRQAGAEAVEVWVVARTPLDRG
ncbi:ComF family protein [Billgrantia gudaonensis]|uniref:ComF family protein n=1 Tax=Billgrantia gudaonensis TaxID=376427 RepID=UPI001FDFA1B2|nr:ComF family protein [Halomonas gudaonensis]